MTCRWSHERKICAHRPGAMAGMRCTDQIDLFVFAICGALPPRLSHNRGVLHMSMVYLLRAPSPTVTPTPVPGGQCHVEERVRVVGAGAQVAAEAVTDCGHAWGGGRAWLRGGSRDTPGLGAGM